MPVYYLLDNVSVKVNQQTVVIERFNLHGLWMLSPKSIEQLIDRRLIRPLRNTPPISYFDALENYATILADLGVETLGDFAGLDPSLFDSFDDDIKTCLSRLQQDVLAFLRPNKPAALPERDCCG